MTVWLVIHFSPHSSRKEKTLPFLSGIFIFCLSLMSPKLISINGASLMQAKGRVHDDEAIDKMLNDLALIKKFE